MAKDDFFVIVFMVLSKVYRANKQDIAVTQEDLDLWGTEYNRGYWNHIILDMLDQGWISGVSPVSLLYGKGYKADEVYITPAGVEYLETNSMMHKAKEALNILPGWATLIKELF